MKVQRRYGKALVLPVLALTALGLAGCREHDDHPKSDDHPKPDHPSDHPKSDHPEGDHPEGDHPKSDHPD